MGLCFWDGPAPRASVSTLSFFPLLFSHKLPDFEGLAGAQEGFTDPWVCPSCRLSVVSGDAAAWSMNQLSRTSRHLDTEGLGCCLWSDTINSHSWCPWSQEPPRLVCRGALHTQCALSSYFLFECVSWKTNPLRSENSLWFSERWLEVKQIV